MAITRSILRSREGTTLQFHYAKRDPSVGTYYTATGITAASVSVYGSDGTEILAPTAMTYSANLRGYIYNWTVGTSLNSRDIVYAFVTPTREASVAAALAPDEIVPVDVSEVLDLSSAVDTYTVRQSLKLISAVLCGKVTVSGNSSTFKSMEGLSTRVVSVADAEGTRTTVTLTP